jgi:hypothetical protein
MDESRFALSRRQFLGYAAPAVAALGVLRISRPSLAGEGEASDDVPSVETPADDEGPFYREGAPERFDVHVEGSTSPSLTVTGVVRAEDGTVLSGVLLDLWHADAGGAYDMRSKDFRHRGKLKTNDKGEYRLVTNLPGQYGQGLRPRHIHLKISGEGLWPLTTQMYFQVRPDRDAPRELVVPLTWTGEGKARKATGVWPVILARKPKE